MALNEFKGELPFAGELYFDELEQANADRINSPEDTQNGDNKSETKKMFRPVMGGEVVGDGGHG